ncbi:MAG TPA: TetR/AcrR family transcriptional regulator [Chitinophagaceae bacterium]|nr:TetR/AcrR family transcriptional regulator [Chitinophagaceae bacterium]
METKERILVKADELFNRYGIRSVSMDDLATGLGISKKTVYQYYTDKDELVDAVFKASIEENKKCCLAGRIGADNAVDEVLKGFEMVQVMLSNLNPSVLFDLEKYHTKTYKKFLEFKDGFLYGMIKENIERGIKEEMYRADIDIDIMTRYRLYSIMLSFNPEVFPNNRSQLVHIEQQLLEHFIYGIATAKGQKHIEKYKNHRNKK